MQVTFVLLLSPGLGLLICIFLFLFFFVYKNPKVIFLGPFAALVKRISLKLKEVPLQQGDRDDDSEWIHGEKNNSLKLQVKLVNVKVMRLKIKSNLITYLVLLVMCYSQKSIFIFFFIISKYYLSCKLVKLGNAIKCYIS